MDNSLQIFSKVTKDRFNYLKKRYYREDYVYEHECAGEQESVSLEETEELYEKMMKSWATGEDTDNIKQIRTRTSQKIEGLPEKIEALEIVFSVYNYLKREYELIRSMHSPNYRLVGPLADVIGRTAGATGVSRRIVYAVLKFKRTQKEYKPQLEHNYYIHQPTSEDVNVCIEKHFVMYFNTNIDTTQNTVEENSGKTTTNIEVLCRKTKGKKECSGKNSRKKQSTMVVDNLRENSDYAIQFKNEDIDGDFDAMSELLPDDLAHSCSNMDPLPSEPEQAQVKMEPEGHVWTPSDRTLYLEVSPLISTNVKHIKEENHEKKSGNFIVTHYPDDSEIKEEINDSISTDNTDNHSIREDNTDNNSIRRDNTDDYGITKDTTEDTEIKKENLGNFNVTLYPDDFEIKEESNDSITIDNTDNHSIREDNTDNNSIRTDNADDYGIKKETTNDTEIKKENLGNFKVGTKCYPDVLDTKDENTENDSITMDNTDDNSIRDNIYNYAIRKHNTDNHSLTPDTTEDFEIIKENLNNFNVRLQYYPDEFEIKKEHTDNDSITIDNTDNHSIRKDNTDNHSITADTTDVEIKKENSGNFNVRIKYYPDDFEIKEENKDNDSITMDNTDNRSVTRDNTDDYAVKKDNTDNYSITRDNTDNRSITKDTIEDFEIKKENSSNFHVRIKYYPDDFEIKKENTDITLDNTDDNRIIKDNTSNLSIKRSSLKRLAREKEIHCKKKKKMTEICVVKDSMKERECAIVTDNNEEDRDDGEIGASVTNCERFEDENI